MKNDLSTLYTIGYTSCSSPEEMITTLREHHIQALIDVRSVPYSSYYEQYDKENLRKILKKANIHYGNFRNEFGARQENHAFYKNGRLDFDLFSHSQQFLSGMKRVEDGIHHGYCPVLMCAEKNPITCHRAIMIARKFKEAGYRVIHLLPDGKEKKHEELERDLLNLYFPDREQISLFDAEGPQNDQERLRKAYELQNDKIGFQEENLTA